MPRNSNAKAVALKVIEQIQNKERPNVKKAMIAVGYSPVTADSKAKRVTVLPEYQKTIKSFESRLDRVIDIGLDIIEKKKGKATFRDGIEATEKMTKLKRLVTGQSTENVSASIASVLDSLESAEQTTQTVQKDSE